VKEDTNKLGCPKKMLVRDGINGKENQLKRESAELWSADSNQSANQSSPVKWLPKWCKIKLNSTSQITRSGWIQWIYSIS